MQILIVGAGTMGRWFADIVDGWLAVTFVDADPSAAAHAADAHRGEHVSADEIDAFDVVCTAVPLSVTPAVIESYAPFAKEAVVDLSGTMREPVETMRRYAPDCERLNLHPLFAPENAPGNVAVVAENTGEIAGALRRRLREAGNVPFDTTATEHDRAMETVQAKAHAAVIAYALAAEPVPDTFQTPISREIDALAAGVLGGTPRVYAEIQTAFPGAEAVAQAAERIADADEPTFERLYREAAEHVSRPPEDRS